MVKPFHYNQGAVWRPDSQEAHGATAGLGLTPRGRPGSADVLREGFGILLRTLYPACPHATWTLWSELGYAELQGDLLDAPWPKTVRAKAQFASLLCQSAPDDAYFELLTDTTPASDCRLPKTGVSLEWERLLSPIFIASPEYGTRASTLVRLHGDGSAQLVERVIK